MEYDFSRKEDYERLKTIIGFVLRRIGISESPEDLAQEYVCGLLEGKHRHQTVEQFIIDVLRKRSGRKGSVGYAKRQALVSTGSINDIQDSIGGFSADDVDARIHRDQMREFINNREWNLYTEGHSLKEIGEMCGVSESRIHQNLKKQKSRLEKLEFVNFLTMSPEARRWVKGFL